MSDKYENIIVRAFNLPIVDGVSYKSDPHHIRFDKKISYSGD